MSQQETPPAFEELYEELMDESRRQGTFTLETEEKYPDIEIQARAPNKPTANKMRRLMPDGMMNAFDFDEIDDIEDLDESEMLDAIDLSNVNLGDMTYSEEATEVWLDAIEEHCEPKEYFSSSELRDILETLDDDYFVRLGNYMLELGSSAGPVKGFRTE